jgi:hypothetical protein
MGTGLCCEEGGAVLNSFECKLIQVEMSAWRSFLTSPVQDGGNSELEDFQMLVHFKSGLTSRVLLVNPALVRSVVDGVQMGEVKICFDDQHSVIVLGTTDEVAEKLAGASEQTAPSQ